MSDWRIPLSDLSYDEREREAADRVLRDRWLTMGPETAAFEEEFAEHIGARHSLAVSSGTAALHLALLAAGVGRGHEVIQPAVNFVAGANMTVAVGAEPVFADIVDLTEPTIDPAAIEALIGPRTRAVMVMHYGGHLCRMAEIVALCRERGLILIEDACHAPKAPAGTLGDVACFSFFSNKNLATGEGGMLTTQRDDIAGTVRALRSHGMTTLTWDRHQGRASSYDVMAHGFNYRFDEVRAAIGRVQLAKLPANNEQRRQATLAYWERLQPVRPIRLPFAHLKGESSHHLMVAVAESPSGRAALVARLTEARIQTSLHYPCIADFSAFTGVRADSLARSRAYAARTMTLPLYPDLTLDEIDLVCRLMAEATVGAGDSGGLRAGGD